MIKGSCPAGGCALALCCDYRIITEDGSIGLNEVALGIVVPPYFSKIMMRTIGPITEILLLTGELVKARKAKEIGLVHEVVQSEDMLESASEKVMVQWLSLPDEGRVLTKSILRKEFCDSWEKSIPETVELGWKSLSDPKAIKSMDKVLARLSKSKL